MMPATARSCMNRSTLAVHCGLTVDEGLGGAGIAEKAIGANGVVTVPVPEQLLMGVLLASPHSPNMKRTPVTPAAL